MTRHEPDKPPENPRRGRFLKPEDLYCKQCRRTWPHWTDMYGPGLCEGCATVLFHKADQQADLLDDLTARPADDPASPEDR